MRKSIDSKRIIIGERDSDGMSGVIQMPLWRGTFIASWGGGWDHVSVAPSQKRITPSWDDMCAIKDIFFEDDEWVVQFHPAKDQYVSNVSNCLHLWKPQKQELPIPPSCLVGARKGQTQAELLKEIRDVGIDI